MRSIEKPRKINVTPMRQAVASQEEWDRYIQSEFNHYKKMMQTKEAKKKGDGPGTFDFTDGMAKRRRQALLNTIPEIYRQFKATENFQPVVGKAWVNLNMPFCTYTHLDANSHILFAASIWILDQIVGGREGWREIYRLLPRDDRNIDDLCLHDAWDTKYDYDLIYSVEYVLHHRNGEEMDAVGNPRVLTSETLARKTIIETQDRKNFEALIAMIPQDKKDRAAARFKDCMRQWIARFYQGAEPFIRAEEQYDAQIRSAQIRYNKTVDELCAVIDKIDKMKKKKPDPLAISR